ncbi:hypothetical protein C0Q70_20399 [Pomacea canaliculata]|uniref:Protein FAM227B n=1 Tax=Pomacea canaliculata TaxID=400727 RepID=A0A2T7NFI1_POMCA|nr:hypothetical protein C0Q70_20399 [Pomacea canaliculata]
MDGQRRIIDAGITQGYHDSGGSLPTNINEFLAAENLSDWPYPMALEGPLDFQGEGLLLGTQEDIADLLRESAPLGLGLLDDLEDRLQAIEEKLNAYAVHIVTDDKRPSRLAERLFHSPTRAFLTESQNFGTLASCFSSRGQKSMDFADTMMETKKRSLDYCMFPGFRHGELVELPAQLEAPPLLHKITKIQKFNAGFRKFWKKLFLSEASAAIMQDSFWWIFLDKFSKEVWKQRKDLLFDRIADSYVALFSSINSDVKDKFLSVYPNCLAQTVFFAYTTAFPESRWRFDDSFKQYLVNLFCEWVTGLKPVPGTWETWNMSGLEASSGGDIETGAAAKKMMEAAALNKKVDVSLDMESFERLVDQLGKEQNPLPQASGEVSKPGGPSYTRLANSFPQAKKTAKESHQIGPGQNMNGICEATDQEILELERRKHEVNRTIDGLKRELTFCKSAAERKALIERFEELKEADKDVPLIDHKPEASLQNQAED